MAVTMARLRLRRRETLAPLLLCSAVLWACQPASGQDLLRCSSWFWSEVMVEGLGSQSSCAETCMMADTKWHWGLECDANATNTIPVNQTRLEEAMACAAQNYDDNHTSIPPPMGPMWDSPEYKELSGSAALKSSGLTPFYRQDMDKMFYTDMMESECGLKKMGFARLCSCSEVVPNICTGGWWWGEQGETCESSCSRQGLLCSLPEGSAAVSDTDLYSNALEAVACAGTKWINGLSSLSDGPPPMPSEVLHWSADPTGQLPTYEAATGTLRYPSAQGLASCLNAAGSGARPLCSCSSDGSGPQPDAPDTNSIADGAGATVGEEFDLVEVDRIGRR